MTWFRIDDSLPSHRKIDGLETDDLAELIGVWALCGAECAKSSPGHVTRSRIRKVFGGMSKRMLAAIDELVARGFWVRRDDVDGWDFHDWEHYNFTAEEESAKRAAAACRQRVRRAKSIRIVSPVTRDIERDSRRDSRVTDGVTHAVTHSEVTANVQRESQRTPRARTPDPDPTRPDPCVREPAPPASRSLAPVGGNPEREPVIAELRRHAVLAALDHEVLAGAVLSTQTTRPVAVEWLTHAIAEAAGAIAAEEAGGSHMPPAARAKMVTSYTRHAQAPRSNARNGKATDPKSPEAAEAARLAANEAARAAKAAQERKVRPTEPTAEERRANAANAKAARLALARVGSGPSLPPIRGSDEVEATAAERGT